MTLDVIAAARRRTRRRLTAAVLIGVGVLAASVYPAGLYVNARLDHDATVPTAVAPRIVVAPATAHAGDDVLPGDVIWSRVAGVDLPGSTATGPTQVVGGLARGFAHTRGGAVVAGLHLLVRTTPQVGPVVFEPTLADQAVGEYAPAMRTAVADAYRQAAAKAGIGYGQPLGDLPATIAGARVDTYTGVEASLSILTTAVDANRVSRYAATTLTLTWQGDDWRLVAPPQGRWDSQVHIVDADHVGGYPPISGR